MFKKTAIAGLVAAALGSGLAQAQAPAAPASPHTITGNIGFYSQYIFRGLNQTDGDPALQGGLDYSHTSGFYLGTWASNVSWLRDFGAYTGGASLEWDFYGGMKGTFGKSDFGWDVGLLNYYYPGTVAPGVTKANTLEAYGAVTWKWLSAKYSYSIENTFGVPNSDGTWYLDLSANFPVTDKFSVQAHYGMQEFNGDTAGVSNDSFASYKDWKIGATYALPKDFTVGAFYTDTDMNATQTAFYTTPAGRFLGKERFTVFISKTF
ncbi:MAG TPA: TorF family putative porin [Pseudolabrys sp.]|nr:TorF family putative porin [Pseudolabrys sp.]